MQKVGVAYRVVWSLCPKSLQHWRLRHRKFSVRGKRWTERNQEGRKAEGSPGGWIEVSIDAFRWCLGRTVVFAASAQRPR